MQDTVPNALFLLSLKVQTITWFKVLHYSDPPYFPQFSYTYVQISPPPQPGATGNRDYYVSSLF